MKLYRLTGGFLIIVLLICATIFFQYFDLYSASISQEWADAPYEEQIGQFDSYMTKLAWLSVSGLALRTIHDYVFFKRGREIGRLVHNETLKKILFAKVNLFFDVTPIGKIITIFTSDINIFYRAILD